MSDFFGWQIGSEKDLSEEVRAALDRYIERYGLPERILIESGRDDLPVPEGMGIVVRKISLPSNIILIGSF